MLTRKKQNMHLFSIMTTAAPGRRTQARETVTRLRDAAQAATGIPTSAWAVVAGGPMGTFAMSTQVEGTQQFLEAMAKVDASADIDAISEDSSDVFVGPADTIYSQAIATTTDAPSEKPLLAVTRAVVAPGQVRPAVEAAVEMLNFGSDLTNLEGMLTMSVAGQMNELTWIFGLDSGDQGDAAQALLTADPRWSELEGDAGPYFQASGQRLLLARLP